MTALILCIFFLSVTDMMAIRQSNKVTACRNYMHTLGTTYWMLYVEFVSNGYDLIKFASNNRFKNKLEKYNNRDSLFHGDAN